MANSRFEYVRDYECSTEHVLLPDTYIVIRLDGKQFHRFSKQHNYLKPNDKRYEQDDNLSGIISTNPYHFLFSEFQKRS